jgi:hypothetical protein
MSDVFITMYHPETEGVGDATLESFEEVWQDKGWVRVDEATANLEGLKRPRLVQMATERGIKTDDSMGKRVIIDAIQKASSPPDKAAAKADATKKEA